MGRLKFERLSSLVQVLRGTQCGLSVHVCCCMFMNTACCGHCDLSVHVPCFLFKPLLLCSVHRNVCFLFIPLAAVLSVACSIHRRVFFFCLYHLLRPYSVTCSIHRCLCFLSVYTDCCGHSVTRAIHRGGFVAGFLLILLVTVSV